MEHAPSSPLPNSGVRSRRWWLVALSVVGIVIVAWLVLIGLPFGQGEPAEVKTSPTETIAERTPPSAQSPPSSATIVEITQTSLDDADIRSTSYSVPPNINTDVAIEPEAEARVEPPPTVSNRTPPQDDVRPTPRPIPPKAVRSIPPPPLRRAPIAKAAKTPPTRTEPVRRPRTMAVRPPDSEVTESEAVGTLRGAITSGRYYPVDGECLSIRSRGYKNVGYTMDVWNSCAEGGGSRLLGRWRVDAKTREVFRQRDDGRYLRP